MPQRLGHRFTQDTGIKSPPPKISAPILYVQLFFTNELFKIIFEQTNLYAKQFFQTHTNLSPQSRSRQWLKDGETNEEEMKAFLFY